MTPWVICGAVLALLVLVVVVALRPDEFTVVRSGTIGAPPPVVFALVNDFRAWERWSPWAKRDPNMKIIHDGPASGVGADYRWSGNKNVGEGRMTLVESQAPDRLRIRLEFVKPFPGVNDVGFAFVGDGTGTRVTWTMSGKFNFITKAVGLVMNMDSMIGRDFEQGLAQLKSVAEAESGTTAG